jgi:hypothetical protein
MFYIPPSRFWVVPVLARWHEPHELTENPWEVDEVLRVPLTDLLDRDRWRHTPLSLEGSAWAWQLEDDLLWGATAIVLGLLLDTAVDGWSEGLRPADLGDELAVRPWEHVPAWERRARLDGDLPAVAQAEVPHVSQAQARAVRAWLDERGVDAGARAEQAGRAAAHAVRRLLEGSLEGRSITVLAGPSSNGWAGLVAARLLDSAGAEVEVLLAGEPRSPARCGCSRTRGSRSPPWSSTGSATTVRPVRWSSTRCSASAVSRPCATCRSRWRPGCAATTCRWWRSTCRRGWGPTSASAGRA